MADEQQLLNKIAGTDNLTTDQALAHIIGQPAPSFGFTSTGSANAQAIAPTRAITEYSAGQKFSVVAGYTNTGAMTLAVSGLAAKPVQFRGDALAPAQFIAGLNYDVFYDGTNFQLIGAQPIANGSIGSVSDLGGHWLTIDCTNRASGTNPVINDNDWSPSYGLSGPAPGWKWMFTRTGLQNYSGGTVNWNFNISFNNGEKVTDIGIPTAMGTGTFKQLNSALASSALPIIVNGDTMRTVTSAAGQDWFFEIYEFPAAARCLSPRLLSVNAGENLVYLCPDDCTAFPFSFNGAGAFQQAFFTGYVNQSGGVRSGYMNRVKKGKTASLPGVAGSNCLQSAASSLAVTNVANSALGNGGSPFILCPGDKWTLTMDSGAGTQLFWGYILEIPLRHK